MACDLYREFYGIVYNIVQNRLQNHRLVSPNRGSYIYTYIPYAWKFQHSYPGEERYFNLYFPDEKTQMSLFLQSHSVIDLKHKSKLNQIEQLFTGKLEKSKYDTYLEEHIQSILDDNSLSIDEKTDIIYESSSELTQTLYSNPEALENAQRSKTIISPILQSILHHKNTIASYIKIIEYDYYTHTHSLNVSIYALCLGAALKLSENELTDLGRAALLHDLGKSKIDYDIVNKAGTLTNYEYKQMQGHPLHGYDLAIKIGIKNKNILDGIKHHHEKIDGSGYPDNLIGEQISMFPRIIGVCDVFDALTTKRSYKAAMRSYEALNLMKKEMYTHLDMKILNTFIQMLHP